MARRQIGCKNAGAVTRYRGDGMSGTTDASFLTQLGIWFKLIVGLPDPGRCIGEPTL
jgi:hypothetical protein